MWVTKKCVPTRQPKLPCSFVTVITFPALTHQLRADIGSELFICKPNQDTANKKSLTQTAELVERYQNIFKVSPGSPALSSLSGTGQYLQECKIIQVTAREPLDC